MNHVKEVCVESFDEAFKAAAAGASRIELCENLAVGGTTPSLGTIKRCLERLPIPVMVMIRPRGGNFTYSSDEFEIMKEDIHQCKIQNVRGVVFGLLGEDGEIDKLRTAQLVQLSRPMEVTFHKAIDLTPDLMESLSFLKEIGVERILTSGGKDTALEGAAILNQMVQFATPALTIVVAGKVTAANFAEISQIIPSQEYHGRKLVVF